MATSVRALAQAGLVNVEWVNPISYARVSEVGGQAYETVAQWPTPEPAADRMVAALEAIAAHTNDADTRSRIDKILDALSGTGRHISLAAATAIVTSQIRGA